MHTALVGQRVGLNILATFCLQTPETEVPLHNARKVWLDGAPADVLQIQFRDGSRRSLSPVDEEKSALFDEAEPLEPADGRYWADLPKNERTAFYYKDVSSVRRSISTELHGRRQYVEVEHIYEAGAPPI